MTDQSNDSTCLACRTTEVIGLLYVRACGGVAYRSVGDPHSHASMKDSHASMEEDSCRAAYMESLRHLTPQTLPNAVYSSTCDTMSSRDKITGRWEREREGKREGLGSQVRI